MRILLTNDDGIFAKGILELAYKLTREHELMIAAPSLEQSRRSHAAITPLRIYITDVDQMLAYKKLLGEDFV